MQGMQAQLKFFTSYFHSKLLFGLGMDLKWYEFERKKIKENIYDRKKALFWLFINNSMCSILSLIIIILVLAHYWPTSFF